MVYAILIPYPSPDAVAWPPFSFNRKPMRISDVFCITIWYWVGLDSFSNSPECKTMNASIPRFGWWRLSFGSTFQS